MVDFDGCECVMCSLVSQFFNQVLMLGKTSVSDLSEHVFDLILELYNIDSHLLLSVLPQLEFKLKVRWLFNDAWHCAVFGDLR